MALESQGVPEEGDAALGGGSHGAVVVDGVLSGDVVLKEKTFRIFLLECEPLPGILGTRERQDIVKPNRTFIISKFKIEQTNLVPNS